MEWFTDDAGRGQVALGIISFVLTVGVVWLGRRRLSVAVPAACVFLLLAAFAIPSAIPARPTSQRHACIHNLRTIQGAKMQWAKESNKLDGDIPAEADLLGANGIPGTLRHRLTCPRGGTYTIEAIGRNPTCSLANKGHRLE